MCVCVCDRHGPCATCSDEGLVSVLLCLSERDVRPLVSAAASLWLLRPDHAQRPQSDGAARRLPRLSGGAVRGPCAH